MLVAHYKAVLVLIINLFVVQSIILFLQHKYSFIQIAILFPNKFKYIPSTDDGLYVISCLKEYLC